ncbi:MAG: hypothetical protein Q9M35_05835 [Rhodothermus sp.]|nr:hypothetical protein [Rhodothermus sp.]
MMRQLRHIGIARGVSLGLAVALLTGGIRPLWPASGASYAAWLRVQLQGTAAEALLEDGVQQALAVRPASPEAFVRAFLQVCSRQDGGASVRAALGLPPDASDEVVLMRLLGFVPRLVADPLLRPYWWQTGSGALWLSLLRMGTAVVVCVPALWERLSTLALPPVIDIPAMEPGTFLFGAVLPMGP